MDNDENSPIVDEDAENPISSADIIKGEICKECGFRCIQGCV